jgi:hypothetical protein
MPRVRKMETTIKRKSRLRGKECLCLSCQRITVDDVLGPMIVCERVEMNRKLGYPVELQTACFLNCDTCDARPNKTTCKVYARRNRRAEGMIEAEAEVERGVTA